MWLKLPQTMAATSSAVVAKQARTRSMVSRLLADAGSVYVTPPCEEG